ncbi:MAG: hypothetical protein J6S63_02645 [Atopobiaceae bacterium]|nr:hypothetical protein [Atopobiaceae bacterium]
MSGQMQKRLLGTAVLLVAVVFALAYAPRAARAAQTSVAIDAKVRFFQEYKVPASGLQSSFDYVIEPAESDAPMPVDKDGAPIDRFTLTREEELWLEFPVKATVDLSATPYSYRYMIRPAKTKLSDGLYYVDVLSTSLEAGVNEYALQIFVQPSSVDAADTLVVPIVYNDGFEGPKVADPGWRVAYAEPEKKPEKEPEKEPEGEPEKKPEGTADDTPRAGTGNNVTGQTTGSSSSISGRASSGGTVASTSNGPLTTTGDALVTSPVVAGVACVGALSLVGASLLRKRAGDDDA